MGYESIIKPLDQVIEESNKIFDEKKKEIPEVFLEEFRGKFIEARIRGKYTALYNIAISMNTTIERLSIIG